MDLIQYEDVNFEKYWTNLWINSDIMHSLHSSRMFQFYKNINDIYYEDKSIILKEKEEIVLGIRISKSINQENKHLFSYYQLPIIYLENKSLDIKLRKKAFLFLKNYLENLFTENKTWELLHVDYINDTELSSLSNYLLNEFKAKTIVCATRTLNLELNEETIFKDYSKGLKYNINWGRKNLNSKIITGQNFDNNLLHQFMDLHFVASGRKTRSDRSWEILKDVVNKNEGFISIASHDDSLVSASFFSKSKKHCFYGVSASNRDMFQNPISHIVVWNAIKYAKEIGCKIFELGDLSLPSAIPKPSKKELNISFFKKSFGNKTNVYLKLKAFSNDKECANSPLD